MQLGEQQLVHLIFIEYANAVLLQHGGSHAAAGLQLLIEVAAIDLPVAAGRAVGLEQCLPAAVADGAVECLSRAVDECGTDILPCLRDNASAAVEYVTTVTAADLGRWTWRRQAGLALRADAEQLIATGQFE